QMMAAGVLRAARTSIRTLAVAQRGAGAGTGRRAWRARGARSWIRRHGRQAHALLNAPGPARPRHPRRTPRPCATPVPGDGAHRGALFGGFTSAGGDGRPTRHANTPHCRYGAGTQSVRDLPTALLRALRVLSQY